MRALIISQDPEETAVLSFILQRAGLAVSRSRNLATAVKEPGLEKQALVVLVPPEQQYVLAVRRVREHTQVPLIVIGEQLEEAVQALLLDSGADLVFLRPFSVRLMVAQVKALLRRAAGRPLFLSPTLTIGGLTLDPTTRTVQIKGLKPKNLTRLEFRLLHTLMLHHGQVVPTEVLVENVWGYGGEGERDLVRGVVSRLRAKIEPDSREPHYVHTVPGVGYVYDPPLS
ncbi:MAG: response regulator transcription factor [Anaerolineae bacterium]